MRVLVTGGSGFIGSHLVDKLIKNGHEAIIYDMSEPKYSQNAEFIKGDVLNQEQLTEATKNIDVIYHLAAEANVNRMYSAPVYSTILNSISTIYVLEAARKNKCKRVLFASTDWVYGSCSEEKVNEDSSLYPPSCDHIYNSSKIASEMYIQNYHKLYGVNYTIMRFGIPFGPRARSATVAHIFLSKAIKGEPIVIDGSGEQFRQFIYVEDLAEGCVACLNLQAENQIINLNGKEKISVKKVAETIKKLMDRDVQIQFTKKREGDFSGKIVSSEKAKKILDWEPKLDYETAMKKYIEWFKYFEQSYIKKIEEFFFDKDSSIVEAIRIIDNIGLRFGVVIDKEKNFLGIITDSDVRKAILMGGNIKGEVIDFTNRNPLTIEKSEINNKEIVQLKINILIENKKDPKIIPVLDKGKVVDLLFYSPDNRIRFLKEEEKEWEITRKILVIGGAGYLGSVLCRKLLEQEYKVRILDIFLFGEESLEQIKDNPNLEIIKGDMRNISCLTKALADVDTVIDLAAIVGDPASSNQPIETIEINYLASSVLALACKYRQINRFIFASTCSVYGKGEGVLTEESKLNPISLYARSKIESEKRILSLTDCNFAPTSIRMGTLYGFSPRMRFDLVANIFAMKAVIDKKITVFGGDQWRPLLNVEDAAKAYIKCLEAPIAKVRGQIFNVGSNEQNYQIKTLAQLVKKTLPETEIEITNNEITEGQIDSRDYNVSFDKIKNILGFTVKHNVEQSILDIKKAIENGIIKNVKDPKYYNTGGN